MTEMCSVQSMNNNCMLILNVQDLFDLMLTVAKKKQIKGGMVQVYQKKNGGKCVVCITE